MPLLSTSSEETTSSQSTSSTSLSSSSSSSSFSNSSSSTSSIQDFVLLSSSSDSSSSVTSSSSSVLTSWLEALEDYLFSSSSSSSSLTSSQSQTSSSASLGESSSSSSLSSNSFVYDCYDDELVDWRIITVTNLSACVSINLHELDDPDGPDSWGIKQYLDPDDIEWRFCGGTNQDDYYGSFTLSQGGTLVYCANTGSNGWFDKVQESLLADTLEESQDILDAAFSEEFARTLHVCICEKSSNCCEIIKVKVAFKLHNEVIQIDPDVHFIGNRNRANLYKFTPKKESGDAVIPNKRGSFRVKFGRKGQPPVLEFSSRQPTANGSFITPTSPAYISLEAEDMKFAAGVYDFEVSIVDDIPHEDYPTPNVAVLHSGAFTLRETQKGLTS